MCDLALTMRRLWRYVVYVILAELDTCSGGKCCTLFTLQGGCVMGFASPSYRYGRWLFQAAQTFMLSNKQYSSFHSVKEILFRKRVNENRKFVQL